MPFVGMRATPGPTREHAATLPVTIGERSEASPASAASRNVWKTGGRMAGPGNPDSFEFEKVSLDDARKATVQWILKLPPHVQPRHLQVKYPRIANRLASLWTEPTRCEPYFEDLLTDKRGGRKGFPLAVAQELASLRDYYFRLHHKGFVAWDHVEQGR
jgi:hypothetical protein